MADASAAHASHPPARTKLTWAAATALVAIATIASADLRGRSARAPFQAGGDLAGRRAGAAADAADAFRVWQSGGARGRHLVILTGQWSKPARPKRPPERDLARAIAADDVVPVDARSAVFAAVRAGIVRSLDAVMPPAAFTHRLGEVSGAKGLVREDGAFRLTFDGLARRFATPRAFVPRAEPVLVLVEPSWFTEGAPADPLRWLAERGASWDLALLALDDPSASDAERRAAEAYARAEGILSSGAPER